MTRPIAHPRDIDAARVTQRILDENPILREKIAAATGLKGAVEGANEAASVDEVLTEVVRFLQLIGTFGQTLTPSHPVDLAWHEFILCHEGLYGLLSRHLRPVPSPPPRRR